MFPNGPPVLNSNLPVAIEKPVGAAAEPVGKWRALTTEVLQRGSVQTRLAVNQGRKNEPQITSPAIIESRPGNPSFPKRDLGVPLEPGLAWAAAAGCCARTLDIATPAFKTRRM